MTLGDKYRTIKLSSFELAALPRYNGQPGEGYFRGANTVDGNPMIMRYVDEGVTREIWYHCEVEDLQLELPRASTEFVQHICF